MKYGVVAFDSPHCAIQAEKYLKSRFPILMMPTPRSISAACGISVRFAPSDLDGVTLALSQLDLGPLYSIYRVNPDGTTSKVV